MRKSLIILLASVMVVIAAAGALAQEADEWSQYQKDKANTGYLAVSVPEKAEVGTQSAEIEARDGSQPVVSGNRAYVYTGVDDTGGSVVCIDLSGGRELWEAAVEPPTFGSWSSPAVAGGLVYIGSGSTVYALDALSGKEVWKKKLGADSVIVNSSPTVDGDRVIIGDWSNANRGKYVCLSASTGSIMWKFTLDADCHAQSTAAVDGNRVFVGQMSVLGGTPNGKVWCIDRETGKPVTSWGTGGSFRTVDGNNVTGSVTVSGEYLYFTDFTFGAAPEPNAYLYCLKKETGKLQWKARVFPSSGAPAVGEGMVVTAGNQGGDPSTNWTFAFKAGSGAGGAGGRLWERKGIGGFNMSASITDGKVLVGNFDANEWKNKGVYCLDADTGRTAWKSTEAGSVPVPTRHGVLSVGNGKLTTFGADTTRSDEFFLAEGTTREGYQEWLCLGNPTGRAVNAKIRYLLSGGAVKDQEVTLPPRSRTTVDVNGFLGPGCDAAVHVTGDGQFTVERSMYVHVPGISGGEQVLGATRAGKSFLFAEGTTREGYQTWLALCNPGGSEAQVIITYMYAEGEPRAENLTIPPNSRRTVDVNASAGSGKDVSIAVTSNRGIVAERVMYFSGVDPLGTSPHGVGHVSGLHNSTGVAEPGRSWYFAEGTTRPNFREWLCLMNPGGEKASATVQYLTADRGVVTRKKSLPPNSRTTVDVTADLGAQADLSMLVTSDRPIVAERPLYFEYTLAGYSTPWAGGHNTVGVPYAAYRWELAEGTTREGFQTYLCIANPNSRKAEVSVEYMINADGARQKKTEKMVIPGNSRHTIDVNNALGAGKDVSFIVSSTLPVVVERAMYFDNNGCVGGGASFGLTRNP